jgi:hypothetical protein
MEVVSATSNILLPFEIIRKAMSVEAHCDSTSRDGSLFPPFQEFHPYLPIA